MKIVNKIDSIKKIDELGLNIFPQGLFNNNQYDDVKRFLEKYPAKYYAIRDKSRINGIFKLNVCYDDVLVEIKDYDLFTINVSSVNYLNNQILVGEIEFFRNGDVYLILSKKEKSGRDASINPDYNYKTNIFDKRLNDIPGFDYIYEYICKYSLFDIGVGINNEKIIIYEIRTDY